MSRSPEYVQGRRAGVKWAITWLYERAVEMNDRRAQAVLNSAGFDMGLEAKRNPNLATSKTKRIDRFPELRGQDKQRDKT